MSCAVCGAPADDNLPSGCLCGRPLPACSPEHAQALIEWHQQDPSERSLCELVRALPGLP